jgi:hypothetical protein
MLKCRYWNHIANYMHYSICKYQYQIFKRMSIEHTILVTYICKGYMSSFKILFSHKYGYWWHHGIEWRVCRSFAIMVVHGLCSCLFCLSNIFYDHFGRLGLLINKGLINLKPGMAVWWFLLRACNPAAPPSLNLLGEIFFYFCSYLFILFCEVLGIKWNALISLHVIHCLAHCCIWS